MTSSDQRARIAEALKVAEEILSHTDAEMRPAFAGPVLDHLLRGTAVGTPGPRENGLGAHAGAEATDNRSLDIADVYHRSDPQTDQDRALVAAYWIQEVQKMNPFESRAVNNALKRLGYPIANITRSLTELASVRPQLVFQVEKSGRTQQAQKKYRVTEAGIRAVQNMQKAGKETTSG
jgi:hypothetical protein